MSTLLISWLLTGERLAGSEASQGLVAANHSSAAPQKAESYSTQAKSERLKRL